MEQLFLLIANMMPEEDLLDGLQNALTEYKITPTDEYKRKISMFAMMISQKWAADHSGKDLVEQLDEFDKLKKAADLLNPDRNSN